MEERGQPGTPPLQERAADRPDRWRPRQSTAIGGLLILVGAILLLGEFVRIDVGHYGWPFFVIAPGVLLLLIGITSRGFVSEGLAIAGCIVTVTGLILLYQNSTDHFESWAYAWALIFPTSVGAGMVLYGLLTGRPGNVRAGTRLVGVGLVLFLLGAAFFEGVIWGGYEFSRSTGTIAAVLIIVLGAVLLILNMTSGRRGSS